MSDDLKELLDLLTQTGVEYIVIGAHAVAFHGRPRATEDIDVWVRRTRENADKLRTALAEFGADIGEEGARRFSDQDRQMVRIGRPPNMIDILNFAGSRSFDEVWSRRVFGRINEVELAFPALEDLIDMKSSAGRLQDLADLERLRPKDDDRESKA